MIARRVAALACILAGRRLFRPAGLLVALLLVLPLLARADLAAGLQAFERKDYEVALTAFEPLARAGDASAQYNLGQMYRQGLGVDRDLSMAAHWYRAAAAQGLARAQFNLGVMYEKGMGVDKSLVRAAEWFQRAADNGHTTAVAALQELRDLRSDNGAELRQQRLALLLAANRDQAEAQYELGLAYALGVGGERDLKLAVNWLRKAALQGVVGAQVQVGVMYANAQGVDLDLVEAYAWLLLADSAGEARARHNLEAMRNRLSPVQKSRAESLAEQLRTRIRAASAPR